MRVLVTGKGGFVGRHVILELDRRGVGIVEDFTDLPDAVIHLAWGGLPNYESEEHKRHAWWQDDFLEAVLGDGITNITVAGSCLELVDNPPAYGRAKIHVRDRLLSTLCSAKWVRLWHLYGEGQREACLLPSLRRAVERGDESFQVIDGARDFMNVKYAARRLVDAALQTEVNGVMDCCTGVAMPVIDFCRNKICDAPILLETGYPMPDYEPRIFCGDPAKMDRIPHGS